MQQVNVYKLENGLRVILKKIDNFFSIIAFSNSLSKTGSLGICFGTNKKNIRNLLEFIFMDIFQITNNGISLYEYKKTFLRRK